MKYELKIDGKTIATYEGTDKTNPVCALMLMAQRIAEEQENKIAEENRDEIRTG